MSWAVIFVSKEVGSPSIARNCVARVRARALFLTDLSSRFIMARFFSP